MNVISKQKYYQFDNVNGVAVNLSGYSKYPINVKKKREYFEVMSRAHSKLKHHTYMNVEKINRVFI